MIHLQQRPVAISFTGGIDSTVLAYWVCAQADRYDDFTHPVPARAGTTKKMVLLACNYGQANWGITWDLTKYHADKLSERFPSFDVAYLPIDVRLPGWSEGGGLFQAGFVPPRKDEDIDPEEQVKTYDYALVDGRNAFLFTTLMSWCSDNETPLLLTGHQYEVNEWDDLDTYRHRTEDFSPMFLDRMNLLQEVGFANRVRIEAPFSSMRLNKYNIVRLGQSLDVELAHKTYSCQFTPICNKCDNCIIRRKAFGLLGVKDD